MTKSKSFFNSEIININCANKLNQWIKLRDEEDAKWNQKTFLTKIIFKFPYKLGIIDENLLIFFWLKHLKFDVFSPPLRNLKNSDTTVFWYGKPQKKLKFGIITNCMIKSNAFFNSEMINIKCVNKLNQWI